MSNILLNTENKILTLTINRPEKLNALNQKTLTEIKSAIEEAQDNKDISAIIITGSGDKSFIAGADISELAQSDAITGMKFATFGQKVMSDIEQSSKPVIAAINGFALGGGCELAMACHIRVASNNAMFGQPEIKLGVIPGFGGTQRLVRLVGKGRALEMNLLGNMIDANRAYEIGLVNKVVDSEELISTVETMAKQLTYSAPVAMHCIIDSINHGAECSLPEGLDYEAKAFAVTCATDDMKEGTAAFLEKRKAKFTGK
ncbi:MAG: enoyl-CoA hydratase/isomerase family protein [Marinicellaceae bacterium]